MRLLESTRAHSGSGCLAIASFLSIKNANLYKQTSFFAETALVGKKQNAFFLFENLSLKSLRPGEKLVSADFFLPLRPETFSLRRTENGGRKTGDLLVARHRYSKNIADFTIVRLPISLTKKAHRKNAKKCQNVKAKKHLEANQKKRQTKHLEPHNEHIVLRLGTM